ncbi:MAG TPA: phospholipase [Methylocella sp.]|nr:phospholipase [Methylocella sp.]
MAPFDGKSEVPMAAQSNLVNGMIVRGYKFVAWVLVAGSLAGACWLLLAFAGLPSAALAAAGRVTIVSGGIPRTAILVEHRRLKQGRRPVVIILRGSRAKGARLRRTFGFEEMARWSGTVLVYPQPLAGHWAEVPRSEANRDAAFIHDLIAKLIAEGIAKPNKVFLVGMRTGGMMALRLACDQKGGFAGLAVLGASLPADLENSCKPSHPLPLLMIARTEDATVPFHGGKANLPHGKAELIPVEATLGLFSKAAGCAGSATTTVFPNKDPREGTRAYLDKLNNCKVPVELVRIEGGSHALPGPSGEGGANFGEGFSYGVVNSARLVWDFFRPLGG